MDSKVCNGCSTRVAKPVFCKFCGVASHPACIPRTGHPHSNGHFINCPVSSRLTIGKTIDGTSLLSIEDLFRSEFSKFRDEMSEMYRAELETIKTDIDKLSMRVTALEDATLAASAQKNSLEEIASELAEREKRSRNLMFFNIEEQDSENPNREDILIVRDICNVILPNNGLNLKASRIGKKRTGSHRPLCVTFSNKEDVLSVVRNSKKYTGPGRIRQDLTYAQREHLNNLRSQLKSFIDSGIKNKSIKYINGIPKIVEQNNRVSKN